MIRNERQYRVTQSELDRLAGQLAQVDDAGAPAWVAKATRESIASQVVKMENELADYEALRSGSVSSAAEVADLAEFPRALIRARIAANMTQRDLAEQLGLR